MTAKRVVAFWFSIMRNKPESIRKSRLTAEGNFPFKMNFSVNIIGKKIMYGTSDASVFAKQQG